MPIYLPSDLEIDKIASFLELVQQKIIILERKINILKKYKEGLKIYAHNYVIHCGKCISFQNLFISRAKKNKQGFQQYTIGKFGIRKLEETNYNILNHKVFEKDNLIIGIGIEEIAFSHVQYGSVSPVYDVFEMVNKDFFDCLEITLKKQLWNRRNFITRKSTRRAFEVDKKELMKVNVFVVDNENFKNVYNSIVFVEKLIDSLITQLIRLKNIKLYFLDKMFI